MNGETWACIHEVSSFPERVPAKLIVRIDSVQEKTTKKGDPFLDLMVTDVTGSVGAKAWGNSAVFPKLQELVAGTIARITGTINQWKGTFSINLQSLEVISLPPKEASPTPVESGLVDDLLGKDLVFDIETVPLVEEGGLPSSVAKTVRSFAERDDGVSDKVMALSPLLGRVVCLAMLDVRDPDRYCVLGLSAGGELFPRETNPGIRILAEEREILAAFWEVARNCPLLISYNGRRFDIPFLVIRSAVLGVRVPIDLLGNRFSLRPHLDLIELITSFGASRGPASLDTCCHAFGIESPKGQMDGSQVPAAFRQGRIEEIAQYNLEDVRATDRLFHCLEETLLKARPGWG